MAAGSGLQPVDLDPDKPRDAAIVGTARWRGTGVLPGWPGAGWRGSAGWGLSFSGAGVPGGVAFWAGDGQAPAAAGAGGDGCGEVAAGVGVEVPVSGGFAGPAGQPEPGCQRDGEVDGPGEAGRPGRESGAAVRRSRAGAGLWSA